jgi:serine/threonine protein kinase
MNAKFCLLHDNSAGYEICSGPIEDLMNQFKILVLQQAHEFSPPHISIQELFDRGTFEFNENSKFHSVLGRGSTSMVFEIQDRINSCALKLSVLPSHDILISKEINVLQRLFHHCEDEEAYFIPIVVARVSTTLNNRTCPGFIMTPLCDRPRYASLKTRLRPRMIHQYLQALKLMHDCGLVHRDVAPRNLLVSREETPDGILIDFSFAVEVGESYPFAGSIETASPRILRNLKASTPEFEYFPSDDLHSLVRSIFLYLSHPERPVGCGDSAIAAAAAAAADEYWSKYSGNKLWRNCCELADSANYTALAEELSCLLV